MILQLGLNKKIPRSIFKKLEQFDTETLLVAVQEWQRFDEFFGGMIEPDPELERFIYALLFEVAYRGGA